jgi:hypothetical protein
MEIGCFPTFKANVALELDILDTYYSLNQRSGLAMNAYVDAILKGNESFS